MTFAFSKIRDPVFYYLLKKTDDTVLEQSSLDFHRFFFQAVSLLAFLWQTIWLFADRQKASVFLAGFQEQLWTQNKAVKRKQIACTWTFSVEIRSKKRKYCLQRGSAGIKGHAQFVANFAKQLSDNLGGRKILVKPARNSKALQKRYVLSSGYPAHVHSTTFLFHLRST